MTSHTQNNQTKYLQMPKYQPVNMESVKVVTFNIALLLLAYNTLAPLPFFGEYAHQTLPFNTKSLEIPVYNQGECFDPLSASNTAEVLQNLENWLMVDEGEELEFLVRKENSQTTPYTNIGTGDDYTQRGFEIPNHNFERIEVVENEKIIRANPLKDYVSKYVDQSNDHFDISNSETIFQKVNDRHPSRSIQILPENNPNVFCSNLDVITLPCLGTNKDDPVGISNSKSISSSNMVHDINLESRRRKMSEKVKKLSGKNQNKFNVAKGVKEPLTRKRKFGDEIDWGVQHNVKRTIRKSDTKEPKNFSGKDIYIM